MLNLRIAAPLLLSVMYALSLVEQASAQSREEKVRKDRKTFEANGFWIYNDLAKGFAEARQTGKPMLVSFRCIPCEECVKLDDELIHDDDRVRPLLEKFVRVRVISANGLDLAQFQFDTDQSFAMMMLNADGTVFGRFGTRSHRTAWQDDVSIDGLAKALEGVLALHAKYPANKAELAAKKGPPPEYPVPEKFPLLAGKFGSQLDYSGNVVKSCIHCHQVGDAQRKFHRDQQEPFPGRVLFPYPHPKAIGLILDPRQCATVLRVDKNSIADQAGFQTGDVISKLDGQPLLSLADVQWVFHNTGNNGGSVNAEILRSGQPMKLVLTLPRGWRQLDDISWRASTWQLRRMALGGMKLTQLAPAERTALGYAENATALKVEHVGQFSPHDAAKHAGIEKGDIVVSFDRKTDLLRETDVIAYSLWNCPVSSKVSVKFQRGGTEKTVTLEVKP